MPNRLPIPLSRLLATAITLAMVLAAFTPLAAIAAPTLDEPPSRLPAGSPTLQEFAASLKEAPAGRPAGIYIAGALALPIVQQPANQPAFVSSQPDVLSQFAMASSYGTTGLLAHNTLAGAEFDNLRVGQFSALILSSGQVEYYRITAIERYTALDPDNPYSDFLAAGGERLSAANLFNHVYQAPNGRLVLQTCIANQGNPSWGRLFIIAEPVTQQIRSALSQAAGVVQLASLGLSAAP